MDHTNMGNMMHDRKDKPAGHGMLLFGEETAYLSHLPMFMSRHDYQAIFEVSLSKPGTDPMAVYLKDRQEHPEFKMYGLAPAEVFVLTDLATPDPQHPLRSSFSGDVWRGHFEDGHLHEKQGAMIEGLDGVLAHVINVVLFRKFDPNAQGLPQLGYFLFGKEQELFLAHAITMPPDFDQVLGVRVDDHHFTDDELRQGMLVTFPGRSNSPDQKVNEKEQVSGEVQVPGQGGPQSLTVQFTTGTEFYFETDDLASGPNHPMHMLVSHGVAKSPRFPRPGG